MLDLDFLFSGQSLVWYWLFPFIFHFFFIEFDQGFVDSIINLFLALEELFLASSMGFFLAISLTWAFFWIFLFLT
jgi:hypothetical protein